MTTNFRQLKTIYYQRKNHRLPEWREFCKQLEEILVFNELVLQDSINNLWCYHKSRHRRLKKWPNQTVQKLKLRCVYDLAVEAFPVLAKTLPFSFFSWAVDAALLIMRGMIEDNAKIADIVNNDREEQNEHTSSNK